MCLNSEVLVVLCSDSGTVFLSFHELPFHVAASPCTKWAAEWPACSLKLVLFSSYSNQKRKRGQTRPGQEMKTKLLYHMQSLTCSTCLFLSFAGLFLVKKGTWSIFNCDFTFSCWQRRSELEHCYATTIRLFKRIMAR